MRLTRKNLEKHAQTSPGARGYLDGQMLVATPTMQDERFARSLIYICAHSSEGAMGIVVNQPAPHISFPDLLVKLEVIPAADKIQLPSRAGVVKVLKGGPVETERGFVLHTDDYLTPQSSIEVGDGVALTATREVLEAMADPDQRPRKAILALGYAGWDGGQLERELQENVWLTCDPDEALLFGPDHEHKWGQALAKIGVSPERLSSLSGRA